MPKETDEQKLARLEKAGEAMKKKAGAKAPNDTNRKIDMTGATKSLDAALAREKAKKEKAKADKIAFDAAKEQKKTDAAQKKADAAAAKQKKIDDDKANKEKQLALRDAPILDLSKPVDEVELTKKYCKFAQGSLQIAEDTPFERWEEMGRFLLRVQDNWQFYLGDWIRFGEKKYGERYAQAVNITSLAYQTLNDFSWVSGAVAIENRRAELGFSFHKAVAPLSPANQKKLLARAVEEKLTVRELRDLVQPLLPKKDSKGGASNTARKSPGEGKDTDAGAGQATAESDKAIECIDWLTTFVASKDYNKLAAAIKNQIIKAMKPLAAFYKANG